MEEKLFKDIDMYIRDMKHQRDIQKKRLAELSECDNLLLKRKKANNGDWYYCAYNKKDNSQKYLGKGNISEVARIKEHRHLKMAGRICENNLKAMEYASKRMKRTDSTSVRAMLPETYRGEGYLSSAHVNPKATEWKVKSEAVKSGFKIYKPEELIIKTDDGSMVRSKSEAMIYNYLLSAGVCFVYELPIRFATGLLVPDFTLLSETDYESELLIEHQGMMGERYYRERFAEKVYKYLQNGYIQGLNIFYTFDGVDGGFDKSPIEHIVRTRIRYL